MASRPEVVAPPEIFYDDGEARKYTSSSRILQIQGLGLRPIVIHGAVSISVVQWLCNFDKSSHNPRLRLKCLTNGARAVFQVYPENIDQRELILNAAMRAGFAGGIVVDFPHRYVSQTGIDPGRNRKKNKSGKGMEWILRKKEQMRRRGNVVPRVMHIPLWSYLLMAIALQTATICLYRANQRRTGDNSSS